MNEKFNDGGPAFPQSESMLVSDETGSHIVTNIQGGASLWDFYAAMDLPVSEDGDWLGWFNSKVTIDAFGSFPETATALDKMKWLATVEAKIRALRADAMIAERETRFTNQEPKS